MHDSPVTDPAGKPSSTVESPQPDRGAFAPPPDYQFEPELQGATPRALPTFDRPGRLERGRRMAFLGLLTAGALCLILAPLPIVQEIGQYFLPLGWLNWIGGGCLVLAVGAYAWKFISAGPYRYIQDGVPIVARVVELVKAPTSIMNGEPTHYAFHAVIEFPDPRFGELRQARVQSNQFSAGMKDDYVTTFRAGDYVTAIHLPRELEKTIRLYGFLDLNPDIGLVRRGKLSEKSDLWKVPLVVAAIVGFFGILCWNIYAYGRYHPVEFDYSQAAWPMVIGGVVLGGALLAVIYIEHRVRIRKIAAHNEAALASGEPLEIGASAFGGTGVGGWVLKGILFAGALLMGALTMVCWCFTYNALADDSPAAERPVAIKEFWQTTHSGIFREYTIEYVFPGSDETYKLMTDPGHMNEFLLPIGMAQVHAGRLGWKWVKTIRPMGAGNGAVPWLEPQALQGP